ncbi:MAG: hypothetical protein ABI480_13065 [Chitinophagaceae bacterium]
MIKRNTYSIPLVIMCVLLSVAVAAQDKTTVSVTVDRTKILIGEPIHLILKADIPQNQPIRFFQYDSLPHFEFLRKDKIDTTNTSNGTILSQSLQITSFDSGHWVIPAFVWYENTATDSLSIDVGFTPFDTTQPYHDIKDVIGVNPVPEKKKTEWWFYAIGGAIVLLTVVYFLTQKKKKPVPKPVEIAPDAYKIAMEELAKLQQAKPEAKQYYSRLVDVFRNYVFAKKGIHSRQQTTDDLVVQLRSIEMSKDMFEKLSQSLRLSDFVKFAKYIPTQSDDQDSFNIVKQSIDHIEQMKS